MCIRDRDRAVPDGDLAAESGDDEVAQCRSGVARDVLRVRLSLIHISEPTRPY